MDADAGTWAAIKKNSVEHEATLTITGYLDREPLRPFPAAR